MKMKFLFKMRGAAAIAVMLINSSAFASIIAEVESNNTLATAQNVGSSFSTGANANIYNAASGWEWVSITGTGDGSFDYYSFFAEAGRQFIFDIDNANIQTSIGLWADGGALLFAVGSGCAPNGVFSPCAFPDAGSTNPVDPILGYTFAASGNYIIGVGKQPSNYGAGGFVVDVSTPLAIGDNYTLQISRNNYVPEPATIAMMGLGFLVWRFKRKTHKN